MYMDYAMKSRMKGKFRIPMLSAEGRKEKIKQELSKYKHNFKGYSFSEVLILPANKPKYDSRKYLSNTSCDENNNLF